MTREERLDWLCRLRSSLVWFDIPSKDRLMLEEALSDEIKALEQEPCEDAISREAVLSLPRLITDIDISTKTLTESVDIKMIESLPSVTPKPKTGHWINLEKTKYKGRVLPFWSRYECSECGNHGQNDFYYCPSCGAKMESEETK